MRAVSARPPEGWTAKALDDLPGRCFGGWYLAEPGDDQTHGGRIREAVVQNLRTRYAADPSRLTDVVENQVQGPFAGVYFRSPQGGPEDHRWFLMLQRTSDGWRVLSVGEATASWPLAEELRASVVEYHALMRTANVPVPTDAGEAVWQVARSHGGEFSNSATSSRLAAFAKGSA